MSKGQFSMKQIISFSRNDCLWNKHSNRPYWDTISPACETLETGSERVAQYSTSILFWLLFFPMIHLLLNTSVYGIGHKRIDAQYGQDLNTASDARISSYFIKPETKIAILGKLKGRDETFSLSLWNHIHSARIVDGYRNNGESGGAFVFYCFAFSCINRWCSITRCFFPKWRKAIEDDEISPEDLELFEHDPRFWQQPWQFLRYFRAQGKGSRVKGLSKYFYTLRWKTWQLVKMTVGYWDYSLIENMQIKSRSTKLNLDLIRGEAKHEEMLANVGLLHALIWQVLPKCVFVGKFGEVIIESSNRNTNCKPHSDTCVVLLSFIHIHVYAYIHRRPTRRKSLFTTARRSTLYKSPYGGNFNSKKRMALMPLQF